MRVVTVNRHTGGLEIRAYYIDDNINVNRHTGGLEKLNVFTFLAFHVNRHTGGLEILPSLVHSATKC